MSLRSTLTEQAAEKPSQTEPANARSSPQIREMVSDYIALTKPRIISLLLLTTLIPMFLAGDQAPSGLLILWVMVGGFLAAGGANAINQYIDRDIDHVMTRTRKRPLPGGRMRPFQVLAFGIFLGALSFALLWWAVNLLTAVLAMAGLLFYVLIYSWALKRSSTQNIVIGGAAGAIPPLVGWAAVANEISLLPIFLFLIVFYWTPPHFWALALMREKEYGAAGVPMLPVICGSRETYKQMVIFSVLLMLISLAPVFLRLLGPVYLVLALILNIIFLRQAIDIYRNPIDSNVWRLYKYSLLYLALLFLAMGADRLFYAVPAYVADISLHLPF